MCLGVPMPAARLGPHPFFATAPLAPLGHDPCGEAIRGCSRKASEKLRSARLDQNDDTTTSADLGGYGSFTPRRGLLEGRLLVTLRPRSPLGVAASDRWGGRGSPHDAR